MGQVGLCVISIFCLCLFFITFQSGGKKRKYEDLQDSGVSEKRKEGYAYEQCNTDGEAGKIS